MHYQDDPLMTYYPFWILCRSVGIPRLPCVPIPKEINQILREGHSFIIARNIQNVFEAP